MSEPHVLSFPKTEQCKSCNKVDIEVSGCGTVGRAFAPDIRDLGRFRYDSRVVMYDLRGFIRLATDQVISQSAIQYCCGVGVQRKCFYFESREVKKREDGLEK